MSKIRLHGSSSGHTEVAPAAAAGNNTVTLPNSAGTLLLTDGSAASLTQIPAANLVGVCTSGLTKTGGFGGGKFESYAIICDQKSLGTDGGTFTAGGWRTRDLNTELIDADGIVSISSNQFTLQAGTYFVEAAAPAYKANRHMIKLYQTSGTAGNVVTGTSMYATNASAGYNIARLFARFTISEATTYEIQHYAESSETTYGFGVGTDLSTEIYTVVKIFKET